MAARVDPLSDPLLFVEFSKVEESLGLVFGFAIICLQNGEPYYDLQDDHIPESVMLKGATNFMFNNRSVKEMHRGDEIGTVVFAFPLTTEIAEKMGIETKRTGFMVAIKPDKEVFERFKTGDLSGFSIGGRKRVG